MTDQRNRLTTDPGLGPTEPEHHATLRSIVAADPVADDENTGAPVYYQPSPLNPASEHKTLELETVKLSKDIDPRKLPTELKLRRPVLHVMPASDPNWPAPPPQYDSSWPPPETVVTTSQPPQPTRRRSFIPLVLLVLLGGSLLLVLGASAWHRSAASPATMQRVQAATRAVPASPDKAAEPPSAAPTLSSEPALPSGESTSAASASAAPAEAAANAVASAAVADPAASAASARFAEAPHHTNSRPSAPFSPSSSPSIANSPALSAPSTAKPKRAIY